MSSRFVISGDSPPCTQRNCWFISAAKGRQSKASIHASYTLSEYLILPVMGENRAGRSRTCQIKQPRSRTLGQCASLGWRGLSKGPKKLPLHVLKTAQFHSTFMHFFFLFESNRNSSDMCKYQGRKKRQYPVPGQRALSSECLRSVAELHV